MPSFATLRRHRRGFATASLAAWLFLLAASMAYACGWHGDVPHGGDANAAIAATSNHDDDALPPGCEDACKDQVAVTVKSYVVQDQPLGPPLVTLAETPPSSPALPAYSRTVTNHSPPSRQPVSILFLRLQL